MMALTNASPYWRDATLRARLYASTNNSAVLRQEEFDHDAALLAGCRQVTRSNRRERLLVVIFLPPSPQSQKLFRIRRLLPRQVLGCVREARRCLRSEGPQECQWSATLDETLGLIWCVA